MDEEALTNEGGRLDAEALTSYLSGSADVSPAASALRNNINENNEERRGGGAGVSSSGIDHIQDR
ncbi:unnamed protein product, partial [Allacma fusca]